MKGMGILCWDYSVFPAKTVTRKIGKSQCQAGREGHQGLCYKPCPARTIGVGPVCWTACGLVKAGFVDCAALCTNDGECAKNTLAAIESIFTGAFNMGKTLAAGKGLDIKAMADTGFTVAKELSDLPMCPK